MTCLVGRFGTLQNCQYPNPICAPLTNDAFVSLKFCGKLFILQFVQDAQNITRVLLNDLKSISESYTTRKPKNLVMF